MKKKEVTALDPSIVALELDKIGKKVANEKNWDEGTLEKNIHNYRHFLMFMLIHPDMGAIPTYEIDDLWHAHILDTRKYAEDCNQIFGYFVHHVPAYTDEKKVELHTEFLTMATIWEKDFGFSLGVTAGGCHDTKCTGNCGCETCKKCNSCSGCNRLKEVVVL